MYRSELQVQNTPRLPDPNMIERQGDLYKTIREIATATKQLWRSKTNIDNRLKVLEEVGKRHWFHNIEIYNDNKSLILPVTFQQDGDGDTGMCMTVKDTLSFGLGIDQSNEVFKISPECPLTDDYYFAMNSNGQIRVNEGVYIDDFSDDDTFADLSATALVTERAIGAYVAAVTYWDRNAVLGYLYPRTITDSVGIGTIQEPESMLQVVGDITQPTGQSIIRQVLPGSKQVFAGNNGFGQGLLARNIWMTPVTDSYTCGNDTLSGGCFDGEHIWMAPSDSVNILRVNPADGSITEYVHGKGVLAFNGAVWDGTYVWFVPFNSDDIIRLDPNNPAAFDSYAHGKGNAAFFGGTFDGTHVWMAPVDSTDIIRVTPATGAITSYAHTYGGDAFRGAVWDGVMIWLIPNDSADIVGFEPATPANRTEYAHGYGANSVFAGGVFDGVDLWLIPRESDYIVQFDVTNVAVLNAYAHGYGANAFSGGCFDGEHIWLSPHTATDYVKVNPLNGDITGYAHGKGAVAFYGAIWDGTYVWFVPYQSADIVRLRPQEFGRDSIYTGDTLNVGGTGYFATDLGVGTIAPVSLLEIWDDDAHPILSITADHANAYDPQIQFRTDTPDTVKFSIGVDAADDSLKIFSGTGIGGTDEVVIDTVGRLSVTTQTAGYPPIKAVRETSDVTGARGLVQFMNRTDQNMIDGYGARIDFGIEDNTSGEFNIGHIGVAREGHDRSGKMIIWSENAGVENVGWCLTPVNYAGINTANPVSILELWHDSEHPILSITADHASNFDPQIQFRTDTPDTVKFSMGVDAANDFFKIYSGTGVGGTTEFVIDTTGQLALGIGVPTTNFHIYESNVETEPAFRIEQGGAGDASIEFDTPGDEAALKYVIGIDDSAEVFKISANVDALGAETSFCMDIAGRVGLGVIPSADVLEVNGNIAHIADNQYNYFGADNDARITYDGTDLIIDPDIVGSGIVRIGATGDNRLHARFLGLGTVPATYVFVRILDAAVVTNASVFGVRSTITKTAGATNAGDKMYGYDNQIILNQAGGVVGSIYGARNFPQLLDGTTNNMWGADYQLTVNGTVNTSIFGVRAFLNINAPATVNDCYALYAYADNDAGTRNGTTYMVYLNENSNVDYGIYQSGTAINFFGGAIQIDSDTNGLILGASQDVSAVFNGTDMVLDYDLLNAGTTDFRIQEDGVDMFVITTGGVVSTNTNINCGGMVRMNNIWHAYGGFEDEAETIACGVGDWNHITNGANDLWNLDEADNITEVADVFTLVDTGDYNGVLSLSISALNGKDFHVRVYNNTQARVEGRPIGISTTGANNEMNICVPIYIEGTAGDAIQFEIMSADGTDPVVDDAIFWLAYLHD
ncbi:MAG: hypothetical protein GY853_13865 [PVC group bacterium]|nr:hypothetical protein [PVC group bacterium]